MSKRLVLGVTLGGSSRLLDGQAAYFKQLGYDVYLISQDHYKEKLFCEREGVAHLPIDIVADINPLSDFRSLIQIIHQLRRVKPDIVNVGTPKMGLLGIVAASILGVKCRVYTCRGLRFETEKGFKRKLLMWMEWLTVRLANKVIYVSPSLKNAALRYKVGKKNKSVTIGMGSSNGVDLSRYNQDKISQQARRQLLKKLSLKGKFVIGFVGRVTRHKGVYELVKAFEQLYSVYPNIRLVLMGHLKCDQDFEAHFRGHPAIIHIPFQDDVPLYMSLFDTLVLPSWREGFPSVPIQAAAMGIPVIVSDATGCVDSISENQNGLVFEMKKIQALKVKLSIYINDIELREKHGVEGIAWAKNFEPGKIWEGIDRVYTTV